MLIFPMFEVKLKKIFSVLNYYSIILQHRLQIVKGDQPLIGIKYLSSLLVFATDGLLQVETILISPLLLESCFCEFQGKVFVAVISVPIDSFAFLIYLS